MPFYVLLFLYFNIYIYIDIYYISIIYMQFNGLLFYCTECSVQVLTHTYVRFSASMATNKRLNYYSYIIYSKLYPLTRGQPTVCSTRPGWWLAGSTSHSSFTPIPYVCGLHSSRRLNFSYSCLARCPWQPSAKIVTLALSSMPRSNVSCGFVKMFIKLANNSK